MEAEKEEYILKVLRWFQQAVRLTWAGICCLPLFIFGGEDDEEEYWPTDSQLESCKDHRKVGHRKCGPMAMTGNNRLADHPIEALADPADYPESLREYFRSK